MLWNGNSHTKPVFEARMLNLQVRFDDLELAAESRVLALGSQDAAQKRRESHDRVQRAIGCLPHQIRNRRQGVEQKMGIELSSPCAQFCLSGQF
jgi:hypothetical protein